MLEVLKRNKKYAIIIAVILLPLCYSFFYLYAFWDPYSHMQELPVAIVNSDVGANINGDFRNVGNEILDKLKTDDSLKWVITNEKDAQDGLHNRRYYAEVLIPKGYSKKLSTSDKVDKDQGILIYQPEEKRNFLASQVLNRVMLEVKDNISQNVTKDIVDNIVKEIKKVPENMADLNDGIVQLHDGSKTLTGSMNMLDGGLSELVKNTSALKGGSKDIYEGARLFASKLSSGSSQVKDLVSGSQKFSSGMKQVKSGLSKVEPAVSSLKKGSNDLYNGASLYSDNAQSFSQALNSYLDSVSASAGVDKSIAQLISAYVSSHPEAMNDSNIQNILGIYEKIKGNDEKLAEYTSQLKAASTALTQGSVSLKTGSKNLNDGITQFDKGISDLPGGVAKLTDSYSQINDGIEKVNSNIAEASKNAKDLSNGIKKLNQGIVNYTGGVSSAKNGSGKILSGNKQIQSGLSEVNKSVSKEINKSDKDLSKLIGIGAYASNPVKMDQSSVDPVPDYGTAFTPYFVSLSFWVGAILIFIAIYWDPLVKFKLLSKDSNKIMRFLSYSVLSIIQALLLAFVIKNGLKLTTKNTFLFYITMVIISLSFMMIVQFFMVNLKEVGKFISLLLLILQLTSCGGTFPMELVPEFFKKITLFMPMTYSVNALKEVISGVDYGYLTKNILILSGMGILLLLISTAIAVISGLRGKQNRNDLEVGFSEI